MIIQYVAVSLALYNDGLFFSKWWEIAGQSPRALGESLNDRKLRKCQRKHCTVCIGKFRTFNYKNNPIFEINYKSIRIFKINFYSKMN